MDEKLQHPWRSRLIGIGLLTPVLLIAALALISRHLATDSVESFNEVRHTYWVIGEIDAARAALVDIETGQRGFTITGRENYLEAYTNAAPWIASHITRIRELVGNNPVQRTNVMELAALADQKLARVELTISVRQRNGFEAAQRLMAGDEGKILMDRIRLVAARMRSEELRLLAAREDKYRTDANRVEFSALAFVAADLLVLLVVVLLMVRLQRLQNLVSVCAWTQRVDQSGEGISFEVYLKDRFGVKTSEGVSADVLHQITRELEDWAKKKESQAAQTPAGNGLDSKR